MPAAPSSDFFVSLRASGLVKRLFGVAVSQRPRQATFSCRCEPAASSSDFFASLRASGLVKRLFGVAVSQRRRHATFWEACVPAAPSCDILRSLRASDARMRHDDKHKAAFPYVVPMLFQRWEWGLELVDGHGLAGSEAEAVDVNFA